MRNDYYMRMAFWRNAFTMTLQSRIHWETGVIGKRNKEWIAELMLSLCARSFCHSFVAALCSVHESSWVAGIVCANTTKGTVFKLEQKSIVIGYVYYICLQLREQSTEGWTSVSWSTPFTLI